MCDLANIDWAYAAGALLLVNFATCFASYIVSFCRVRTAGLPVQRMVWTRTRSYMMASCLVDLPYICYVVLSFWVHSQEFSILMDSIGSSIFNLNGFVNFVAYAFLNRRAHLLFAADRKEREFSYEVTFRSEDSFRMCARMSYGPQSEASDRPRPALAKFSGPQLTSYFADMFSQSDDGDLPPTCPVCAQGMLWSERVRDECAEEWSCSFCHSGATSFSTGERWSARTAASTCVGAVAQWPPGITAPAKSRGPPNRSWKSSATRRVRTDSPSRLGRSSRHKTVLQGQMTSMHILRACRPFGGCPGTLFGALGLHVYGATLQFMTS